MATVGAIPNGRVSIDQAASVRDLPVIPLFGRKAPHDRVPWVRSTEGASRAPVQPDGLD